MALGLALSISLTAVGCGNAAGTSAGIGTEAQATTDTSAYAGQTVYGVVDSVDEEAGTFTVSLGELSADGATVTAGDEKLEITVTEDTKVTSSHSRKSNSKSSDGEKSGSSKSESSKSGKSKGKKSSSGSDTSDAQSSDGSVTQPPELPDGEAPAMNSGEQPPELPDGEAPAMNGGEQPPELPAGEAPAANSGDGAAEDSAQSGSSEKSSDGKKSRSGGHSKASLKEGAAVEITFDEQGQATKVRILSGSDLERVDGGETGVIQTGMNGAAPDGAPGGAPGGSAGAPESYDAATAYSADAEESGGSIASAGTDENAVLVQDGADVKLSGMTITRESSNSTGGDASSFYGIGSAVLVTDGTVTVSDSTITTDAAGGAGVFAYGSGIARVSDTVISTAQGTSGGIHVAGGGTLYAENVTATTEGGSSAAIRSDRGGGTMVVDGGSYTSGGSGSPAIYSTADITVHGADLAATASEAICIEGLNSIRLFDCDLSGNMPDSEQNDCTWNVILYQSMSGDAEVGNSTFEMIGGTLTAQNGGMFYTTNTESTFILQDVDIEYAEENDFFLKATGNVNQRGWGSSGANGADCLFTAISQEMEGDVIWDSISELDMYLTDGSTLTGAVIDDETAAGSGGSGYCNLYISSDSTWVVTGDSTLTGLYCEGTLRDASGKTVTVQTADGTVLVKGDSSYTVTVQEYKDTADLSGASQTDSWETYAELL